MTTDIEYIKNGTGNYLCVSNREGNSLIECSEFNRHHEGVWNSRVLAFVPQQTVDKSGYRPHKQDTHFSDGTPVASYEGWRHGN